jgi:hypothetical protein
LSDEDASCGDPYECWKELRGELAAANARAEAAEREREVFDDQAQELSRTLDRVIEERGEQYQRAERAESESAALRTEVERLREFPEMAGYTWAKAENLAAANALLTRAVGQLSPVSLLARDIDAHLAAQPATASTCTCLGCVDGTGCMFVKPTAPTRTEPAQGIANAAFLRGVEWARGNPDVGWPGR